MATLYLDYEGGNDASDGTSFANRVKTYDRIQALYAVGDTIRMMAAPAVQSLGTNIAWVDGQPWVTASSAQWAVIDDFESGWTASANVTITTTSSRKTGTLATSFAIGSAFTTGKAAYKTISSTDFSAYQQISLWMKRSTGTTATLSIALCSDTTGDTVVDSMTLPTATTTSGWIAAVVDKAAALGSSIQSIALYVGTDNGAVTVVLDNLIACKAAGGTGEITHRHMIGRPTSLGAGSGGYDCWFAIRGFEGTKIYVDTDFTQDCQHASADARHNRNGCRLYPKTQHSNHGECVKCRIVSATRINAKWRVEPDRYVNSDTLHLDWMVGIHICKNCACNFIF